MSPILSWMGILDCWICMGAIIPLTNNGIMLHATTSQRRLSLEGSLHMAYLLILSIRSIFLIPSQCRMSGISA